MELKIQPRSDIAPKQARSRARRQALIEHGAALLETSELDEISVAEITGALGYSTGSFYSYFADKEAFFIAVQQWVNDDLDPDFARVFGEDRMRGATLEDRLTAALDFTLSYFRRRTGVIRSALRYERRIPAGWAPNRARTRQIIETATSGLDAASKDRLETALQLALGMLVNALLHDPGPLRLADAQLAPRIREALGPYLADAHA